jgi:2-phosphosulfolactate phosphatase
MIIDAILTPAELPALMKRDLRSTTCVVIDVLRATSSMLTALQNGAREIHPVAEIDEALALKTRLPSALLAGERRGVRIQKDLTGSLDFDLGNSPRDFTASAVADRSIIWTTTNGTRALRACAHAERILLGALLNLRALAELLERMEPPHLTLVCAGTIEEPAFEDIFTAGALIDALMRRHVRVECKDSAQVVWRTFCHTGDDQRSLIESSLNARRLLQKPDLAPDVPICLEANSVPLIAAMNRDGVITSCSDRPRD